MSKIISPTIFRNNMKKVMEDIIKNEETYHVTHKGCEGVVVVSSQEYDSIKSTLRVLADRKLNDDIEQASKDIEQGNGIDMTERYLVEPDKL